MAEAQKVDVRDGSFTIPLAFVIHWVLYSEGSGHPTIF